MEIAEKVGNTIYIITKSYSSLGVSIKKISQQHMYLVLIALRMVAFGDDLARIVS